MAKYSFKAPENVLPFEGEFQTQGMCAAIKYSIDNHRVCLDIDSQTFHVRDLDELIELLQSVREHLQNDVPF